jgi:hypothetical protein
MPVELPDGRRSEGALSIAEGRWLATFSGTGQPGLYRFLPSPELSASQVQEGIPFAILRSVAESSFAPLKEDDLALPRQFFEMELASGDEALAAAVAGEIAGEEIWKVLAACALLVMLSEIALARWVTARRRAHTTETVGFGEEVPEPDRLRRDFLRETAEERA